MSKIIERPTYISKLEAFRNDRGHVKVLSGVKRCEKSTFLMQFMEKLRLEGVPENEMLLNPESSSYSDINRYLTDS